MLHLLLLTVLATAIELKRSLLSMIAKGKTRNNEHDFLKIPCYLIFREMLGFSHKFVDYAILTTVISVLMHEHKQW